MSTNAKHTTARTKTTAPSAAGPTPAPSAASPTPAPSAASAAADRDMLAIIAAQPGVIIIEQTPAPVETEQTSPAETETEQTSPAETETEQTSPAETEQTSPAETETDQTSPADAIEKRARADEEKRARTNAEIIALLADQRAKADAANAAANAAADEVARLETIARGAGALPPLPAPTEPPKRRSNGQIIAAHWLAALTDAGALERGVAGGAIETLVDAEGSDGDPLALACSATEDEKHSKAGARLLKDARGAAGKGARGAAIGRALALIVAAAFRESAAIRADADLPAQSRTVREAISKAQITDDEAK